MQRAWVFLVFLLVAACATVPPSPPGEAPEGDERAAREEWFRLRLREADGKVHEESLVRRSELWRAWAAGHPLPEKAGSPLGAHTWQEGGPRNVAGRVLSVASIPTLRT